MIEDAKANAALNGIEKHNRDERGTNQQFIDEHARQYHYRPNLETA
jgi:hypothetical protein